MRRLLIGVAVLAGLLVAADYGLRLYSQSVVADELRTSLKLSESPKVAFGGWPFIPHVLSGDLPSATVKSTDVVVEGVPIHALDLSLEDLTFPASRFVLGGGGTIHAKRGHGFASLTGQDVTTALRDVGVDASFSIRDGHIQGAFRQFRGRVTMAVSGRTLLVFGSLPAGAPLEIGRIRLPAFGRGLRYARVHVGGDVAVLSVELRDAVFVVPG